MRLDPKTWFLQPETPHIIKIYSSAFTKTQSIEEIESKRRPTKQKGRERGKKSASKTPALMRFFDESDGSSREKTRKSKQIEEEEEEEKERSVYTIVIWFRTWEWEKESDRIKQKAEKPKALLFVCSFVRSGLGLSSFEYLSRYKQVREATGKGLVIAGWIVRAMEKIYRW